MNVKIQVGFIILKSLIVINGVHNHETFLRIRTNYRSISC